MKRIILFIFLFTVAFPVKTYAVADYTYQLDEITREYSLNDTPLLSADIETLFTYIKESIFSSLKEPVTITVRVAAVIFLYSISKAIFEENTLTGIADNVCVLTVFISLLTAVNTVLAFVTDNLTTVKNFMTTFIPVYAGIIMSSGEFFTSSVFTGFFLSALIVISNICLNVIIPSLKIFLSLIISDSLSPHIRLKSIGDFYIKTVKNLMKISVSLICFLLTMQTTISRGKDTLAVKAGKVIAGTAIPVIGSTLQDAVSGVYASMESIKGYAGVVGLTAVVMIFLPSIISLAIYWLHTGILYILADITDASVLCKCIKGFTDVIELILSMITMYMVMFIFSVTIMIAVTNGV